MFIISFKVMALAADAAEEEMKLSVILWFFSHVLVAVFGIAAVIFGIIGRKKKSEYSTGTAVAGIVAGGTVVFLSAALCAFIIFVSL